MWLIYSVACLAERSSRTGHVLPSRVNPGWRIYAGTLESHSGSTLCRSSDGMRQFSQPDHPGHSRGDHSAQRQPDGTEGYRPRGRATGGTPAGTPPRHARDHRFVTPLIGLLGTVVGLIESFVNVTSQSGFASATDISSGIYQCLLTTAGGLVVAIPCAVGYSYLSARVNALMHDMERRASRSSI